MEAEDKLGDFWFETNSLFVGMESSSVFLLFY